jgi:hypothetical protein
VKRISIRLLLTVVAAFVVAVISAIAVALTDLYLVGHGRTGLLRESVSWPAASVHMSAGDLIMLGLSFLAGALAWILSGRFRY